MTALAVRNSPHPGIRPLKTSNDRFTHLICDFPGHRAVWADVNVLVLNIKSNNELFLQFT